MGSKNKPQSEKNYDDFGTPVMRKNGVRQELKMSDGKELLNKTTLRFSAGGYIEGGFYGGDNERKIPKSELTIFNEVKHSQRGVAQNIEDENLQFSDTKGFSEIDLILKKMNFGTLDEVTASLEMVFQTVLSLMPADVDEDILWKKLLFVVNTREWSDTASDNEIEEVLKDLNSRQKAILEDKKDVAEELRGKKKRISESEKYYTKRILELEKDFRGRILGDVYVVLEKRLKKKKQTLEKKNI